MGLIFLRLQCDYSDWLLVKDYPITFFENKRFSSYENFLKNHLNLPDHSETALKLMNGIGPSW